MLLKIWHYFFNKPKALPAHITEPTPLELIVSPETGFNMFHSMLLEEAAKRMEKEKEFLASKDLTKAIRLAMTYMMSHEDIFMSCQDIGISADMMSLFYGVFSKLCEEQKIKCELNSGKYIRVNKGSFDAVLASLQDEARGQLIDDKVRQMYSVGIYR